MNRLPETIKRVVIKIGTNLLSSKDSGFDTAFLHKVVTQLVELRKQGYQILLVTSGAIGMGAGALGLTERVTKIEMRQACASIGQPLLMQHYREAFSDFGVITAQILLTREVLNNRMSFLNLKNSVETLLELGTIPVFNENDTVSTAEIGSAFGDNDRLSALIASKTDADLLIILTDIDGLYTGDPRKDPDAKLISLVEELDDSVLSMAGQAGSTFSTGGMKTKLLAAKIAAVAGCGSIIASGYEPDVLLRLLNGEELGTYIREKEKLSQRSRWILNSTTQGKILIDEGAVQALRAHKSLLPSGVLAVEGVFEAGEVVMVNDVAKVVPSCNSNEIRELIGRHSSDIRSIIGQKRRDVIARPEDILFIEK